MAVSEKTIKVVSDQGPLGFIFFAAYIGAAVYFVQLASGFWEVILALLKAAVWPGYVVYYSLILLGA